MVPIKMNHLHVGLQHVCIILWIPVVQRSAPIQATTMMAYPTNRSLYLNEHTHFVTRFYKFFTWRIMRRPDEIAVGITIELNIASYQLWRQDTPCQRMHLMPAYTSQLNRNSVYQKSVSIYLYFAETKSLFYDLQRLLTIAKLHFQAIQMGMLVVPLLGGGELTCHPTAPRSTGGNLW